MKTVVLELEPGGVLPKTRGQSRQTVLAEVPEGTDRQGLAALLADLVSS